MPDAVPFDHHDGANDQLGGANEDSNLHWGDDSRAVGVVIQRPRAGVIDQAIGRVLTRTEISRIKSCGVQRTISADLGEYRVVEPQFVWSETSYFLSVN